MRATFTIEVNMSVADCSEGNAIKRITVEIDVDNIEKQVKGITKTANLEAMIHAAVDDFLENN